MHDFARSASASPPPVPAAAVANAANYASSTTPDLLVWIGVILSAATLAVTCVGVVVAVSAVVGYQSAKRMIKRHAQTQAKEQTDLYLKSDAFETHLKTIANTVLQDHIKDRIVIALAGAGAASGDTGGRIEVKEG